MRDVLQARLGENNRTRELFRCFLCSKELFELRSFVGKTQRHTLTEASQDLFKRFDKRAVDMEMKWAHQQCSR
jgi:hypothetical protein